MDSATSYTPFECISDTKIGRAIDDEALLAQIDDVIERYSASKYDIFRSDLGETWCGTKMSRLEKVMQSVRGHLQTEDGPEDDGEERIEIFMQRIRQMFVRRAESWFVTNRPPKEEVEAAIKAETERANSLESTKENENSINVE